MKYSDTRESLNCQSCYDKGCVSQEIHKVAKGRVGNKINSFERRIEDEGNYFIISYINQDIVMIR